MGFPVRNLPVLCPKPSSALLVLAVIPKATGPLRAPWSLPTLAANTLPPPASLPSGLSLLPRLTRRRVPPLDLTPAAFFCREPAISAPHISIQRSGPQQGLPWAFIKLGPHIRPCPPSLHDLSYWPLCHLTYYTPMSWLFCLRPVENELHKLFTGGQWA